VTNAGTPMLINEQFVQEREGRRKIILRGPEKDAGKKRRIQRKRRTLHLKTAGKRGGNRIAYSLEGTAERDAGNS